MKRIINTVLAVLCFFTSALHVYAEEYPLDQKEWNVTYDGKELRSNYSAEEINAALDGMQPGDSAHLRFNLINQTSTPVDWWMENEVLKSLEDGSNTAKDGAYSYTVTYTSSSGMKRVLYTSDVVGGEQEQFTGLHEATDALDEYLWLEQIAGNSRGVLEIEFLLDGETQANRYQDTLGRLKVDFAVEPVPVEEKNEPRKIVRVVYMPNTGDNSHTGLYIALQIVSGLMLVWIFLVLRRKGREQA